MLNFLNGIISFIGSFIKLFLLFIIAIAVVGIFAILAKFAIPLFFIL